MVKAKGQRTILTPEMVRSMEVEQQRRERELRKEQELIEQIIDEKGELPDYIAKHTESHRYNKILKGILADLKVIKAKMLEAQDQNNDL